MIELSVLLVALLFLSIGAVCGSIIQTRIDAKRGPKQLTNTQICGCRHHKSFHVLLSNGNLGKCMATNTGFLCTCQHFTSVIEEDPFRAMALEEVRKIERGR